MVGGGLSEISMASVASSMAPEVSPEVSDASTMVSVASSL